MLEDFNRSASERTWPTAILLLAFPLIARFGGNRPSYVATVYARREDRDHAFQWLDRAYAIRDTNLESIKYDIDLANLRGDSRYKVLLRKMKLPE